MSRRRPGLGSTAAPHRASRRWHDEQFISAVDKYQRADNCHDAFKALQRMQANVMAMSVHADSLPTAQRTDAQRAVLVNARFYDSAQKWFGNACVIARKL